MLWLISAVAAFCSSAADATAEVRDFLVCRVGNRSNILGDGLRAVGVSADFLDRIGEFFDRCGSHLDAGVGVAEGVLPWFIVLGGKRLRL